MRGMLYSPQRYLEGHLKTLGGRGRNSVRSGSGEHISNKFDGLTHHIGEARSKTRMFQRLNGSSQRCQVFRCHARQVQSNGQRLSFNSHLNPRASGMTISPHSTDVCDRPNSLDVGF